MGAAGSAKMPVEAKEIEQWFLRITQYADELLDGWTNSQRDGPSAS